MAYVGEIYLGGKDNYHEEIFSSGVSFILDSKSNIDKIFTFSNGWEVELKKDHKIIVARNRLILPCEEILTNGFEVCQEALDLLSVIYNFHKGIDDYVYNYIILYNENDEFFLRYYSLANLSISAEASLVHKNKEGKIIQGIPKTKKWHEAFRYYRLSQKSYNVYEGFRNLFLSFECLLEDICKKENNESEKNWYIRSLKMINNKVPLSSFVPEKNNKDPISFIIGTLYEDTRCKLFHSKQNKIMPFESIDTKNISANYIRLLDIWTYLVKEYYNTPFERTGFTYTGFKTIMDRFYSVDIKMVATEDPTDAIQNEKEISPLDFPIITFNETKYKSELEDGHVLIKGTLENEKLNEISRIRRICCLINNEINTISFLGEGISITGIKKFEHYAVIRLLNQNMPKIIF